MTSKDFYHPLNHQCSTDNVENALVRSDTRYGKEKLAQGYFYAALYLIDDILNKSRNCYAHELNLYPPQTEASPEDCRIDLMISPICFLFRHFLEMAFKTIIFQNQIMSNNKDKIEFTHKLTVLWAIVKPILIEQNISLNHEIDNIIIRFDTIDPRGETFRYDSDKNGQSPFPSDTSMSVDLHQLRADMILTGLFVLNAIQDLNIAILRTQTTPQGTIDAG